MADEILTEFIVDAQEHLAKAGGYLISLEKDNSDPDFLNGLLRHLHSIKGNAGFLDLQSIFSVIHKVENTLQGYRQDELAPAEEFIDLLFKIIDELQEHLDDLLENDAASMGNAPEFLIALDRYENMDDQAAPETVPKTATEKQVKTRAKPKTKPKTEAKPKKSAQKEESPPNAQDFHILKLIQEDFQDGAIKFAQQMAKIFENNSTKVLLLDLRDIFSLKNIEIGALLAASHLVKTRIKVGFLLDEKSQAGLVQTFHLIKINEQFECFLSSEEARKKFLPA